jgi:hypothetical protein
MKKTTNLDQLLSDTSSIDLSTIKEFTSCIREILEAPDFNDYLEAFVVRCMMLRHKNIQLITCNEYEAAFTMLLPYMCFVPPEIIALNPNMFVKLKTSNLSRRIFALDDILEYADDIHQVGPYIVDIRMLQHHLYSNLPVTFMDEFMDVLGLSKKTSIRMNNKRVHLTVSPIEKMKKSFSDNLRIVKKKLEAGDPISGQTELGWFFVYQNILDHVEKQNIKDFVFEDCLKALGSVARGLLPESQRHLNIFELHKPNRLDKKMLYDKLYFFYKRLKPDDVQFETLETRLRGLGRDPEIIRKVTAKYYEALTRKMNRYFGIEISKKY